MLAYVSRGGQKLEHGLVTFGINPAGWVWADLGSNVGGFVDCLLRHGAAKVYAIETGYGVLAWKLRINPRVVVMERTNAMHVELPEKVDAVSIDVGWTRQKHILPSARQMVKGSGVVMALIKPHYEAEARMLRGGVLRAVHVDDVLDKVKADITSCGLTLVGMTPSPIKGAGGNSEYLALLKRT
jgi:23S rRNA (cytidine1920-2'-O)/16S rRNA (cytidine1409-2'-O)-methyltransferase